MKFLKYGLLTFLFFLLVLVILRIQARQQDYELSIKGKLFVVNKLDKSITVFNLENGKHITEIFLNTQPREITTTSSQEEVAITNYGSDYVPGKSISVIDAKSYQVKKQITLPMGTRPHGIVHLGQENKVMVATNGGSTTSIIDLDKDTVVSTLHTNQEVSHMIAVHPTENLSYVTHVNSGSVCVVDNKENKLVEIIKCGNKSDGIAITPDGKEVWVTNLIDNTISIIDTKHNIVVETLTSGKQSFRLQFTNDGKFCYVSNSGDGSITIYDRYLRKKIKTIQLPGKGNILDRFLYHTPRPVGILMHPNDHYVFVSNSNARKIEVIDTESMELEGTISTGKVPDGIAIIDY